MDKTEIFIEMCEKAEELQKIGRVKATELDDWYYEKATQLFSIGTFADESDIWLPRQDQLQELTGIESIPTLLSQFNEFVFENVKYLSPLLDSCEKLWLAFVMKKRYKKVWNTESERWEE